MDIETYEAIEALRADLGRVETTLSSKIDGVDARVEASESSLRAEMSLLRADLRAKIRESREETMRHFDIVAESLRDDIRIIAERLVALGVKVDALRCPNGVH